MAQKIVDMTYPMHEGMMTPSFPWHAKVEITQMGRHWIEGRESYKIIFGNHTGTHIDAPAHVVQGGEPRVDKIPLDVLIGPAKLLDIPKKGDGTDGEITLEEIKATGVKIEKGDRIIVRTGWGKHWLTKMWYNKECRPYFELETAMWLVEQGISLIGIDMSGPDNRSKNPLTVGSDAPIHNAFLKNGVFLVESLANLDQITKTEFELICLPWKLKDLDAAPIRCVARFEE